MAEFIDFEASLAAENDDEVIMVSNDSEDGAGGDEVTNFIDNREQLEDNDQSFYRTVDLENAGNADEILQEEYEESIVESQNLDVHNLCHSDEEIEPEVKFANSDKRVKNFKQTFFPADNEELYFKQAILYAIRYDQTKKTCVADDDFNDEISNQLSDELRIELDLRKFNTCCSELTDILMKYGYFLRVFELRSTF